MKTFNWWESLGEILTYFLTIDTWYQKTFLYFRDLYADEGSISCKHMKKKRKKKTNYFFLKSRNICCHSLQHEETLNTRSDFCCKDAKGEAGKYSIFPFSSVRWYKKSPSFLFQRLFSILISTNWACRLR